MFKTRQLYVYLGISLLVILLAQPLKWLMVYLDYFYVYLNFHIIQVFQRLNLTGAASQLLLLIAIPLLLAAIPAVLYHLIKKKHMPYFAELIWILWLIMVFSNILMPYRI